MIYLISSCTNAKNIIPEKEQIISSYDFSDINKSSTKWMKYLKSNYTKKTIARKLYCGSSWKTTLDTERNFANKTDTKLLIASAGHGLIDSDNFICSYGSTFSKGHADSIYNFRNVANPTKEWWNMINKFNIKNLNHNSKIFIFLPYEYLKAMEDFIEELIKSFGKNIFILIASKNKFSDLIEKNVLRFDTRFNSYEKGTLITLSQRCMRWLSNEITIKDLSFNHDVLQKHIDIFLSYLEPYKIKTGKQLNDIDLVNLINEQIKNDNITSATRGLKELRKNGFACEQKRYGKHFNFLLGVPK